MRLGAVSTVLFRDQSIAENTDKHRHDAGQQQTARKFVELVKVHRLVVQLTAARARAFLHGGMACAGNSSVGIRV